MSNPVRDSIIPQHLELPPATTSSPPDEENMESPSSGDLILPPATTSSPPDEGNMESPSPGGHPIVVRQTVQSQPQGIRIAHAVTADSLPSLCSVCSGSTLSASLPSLELIPLCSEESPAVRQRPGAPLVTTAPVHAPQHVTIHIPICFFSKALYSLSSSCWLNLIRLTAH
jgi:hypothetical protein